MWSACYRVQEVNNIDEICSVQAGPGARDQSLVYLLLGTQVKFQVRFHPLYVQ